MSTLACIRLARAVSFLRIWGIVKDETGHLISGHPAADRQRHVHDRALSWCAGQLDPAAVRLDDLSADREPESGFRSGILRRDAAFEHTRDQRRWNAGAAVRD